MIKEPGAVESADHLREHQTSPGRKVIDAGTRQSEFSYEGAERWRTLDLLFILLGLPFLLVIGVVIGAWIKIMSPGSIFYRQTRIGYKGQPFTIYKFRSMHENAATEGHEKHVAALLQSGACMTKLDAKGDVRVIPGASILRNTGLDELPQLINVLRGEMSLVGPRPCLKSEFALYTPAQKERCEVLPGLTGYWQVNGKNGTTFAEMIALDVHYARNRSLPMDLHIILRTPVVLLLQAMGRTPRVIVPAEAKVMSQPVAETSLVSD